MLHRLPVRRVVAWLDRFRRTRQPVGPSGMAASPWDTGGVAVAAGSTGAAPRDGSPPGPTVLAVPNTTAPIRAEASADPPLVPLAPHHGRGLRMVEAQRWNRAQRELELAVREAPCASASADLASVREVRRQLRVLRKWPRDVPAHLALGRCYFELGLGAEAEAIFRRVLCLAPGEPAAPYFLALEHAYRGEWETAERYHARARALAPDLPPLAACLGGQGSIPENPSGH